MKLLKNNWKLILILLTGAFLRIVGISWGLPYNFHPDEWNMAAAVSRLSLENHFNPHFWAYGQFPLYLSYFSAKIYNLFPWINLDNISVSEATFFLRLWSAAAGIATIYLVYLISRKLVTSHLPASPAGGSLIAALLAAFAPGLVQISHFGTTESLLSFFFLLIIYLSFLINEEEKNSYFVLLGTAWGLALGTKISALIFGVPVFLSFIHSLKKSLKQSKNVRLKKLLALLKKYFIFLFFSLIFLTASSPYLLLAFNESRGILLYETSVSTGQAQVFYTRQFQETIPVLFQLQKIFPYSLGWPIYIFGAAGFLITLVHILKKVVLRKKLLPFDLNFCLLTFTFLIYFLSQAFLFSKWVRFIAPIFAFFSIFFALSLSYLRNLGYLRYLIVFLSLLPGVLFSSIYFRPDIRFLASDWIYQNIPSKSRILFDTGNVVDIPILPPNYPNIPNRPNYSSVSFDFYHLDENHELFLKLLDSLENSDYIFVPSRRIFANHLRFPKKYPLTSKYYQLLFSGKLGFEEIKKFSPFPKLEIATAISGVPLLGGKNWSLEISDEQSEETFTVFDHPVIRIYKKTTVLSKNQYQNLFQESLQ